MKRTRRKARSAAAGEVSGVFARGFVTTALLVALQGRSKAGASPPPGRKILRHALQGGAALAAGSVAAEALQSRDYGLALTAMASGAAGVLAAEYLLNRDHSNEDKENGLGQEKA